MPASPAPSLQLVGDGIDGQWITWRWSHQPGVQLANTEPLGQLAARLRAALPRPNAQHLTDLALTGELSDPASELDLMVELSAALLPARLRQEIMAAANRWGRLHVRIAPSPAAAVVPWGLLVVQHQTRLLDVAEVSIIAPILPRDVADQAPQPRAWKPDAAALIVVDPTPADHRLRQVLTVESTAQWRARLAGQQHAFLRCRFTRQQLGSQLAKHPSRLLLVGHCLPTQLAGDTGFLLSDSRSEYGVSPPLHHLDARVLTAADLLLGTQHLPGGAPGYELWPMPPRVGIVACSSGADHQDHEPFGLVTAALTNGAELVQATLWSLPTDFAWQAAGGGPGFTQLASAVDDAQQAADPAAALNAWQRKQLAAWRDRPGVATSPLWWAAAVTVTAPQRRLNSDHR